MPARVVHVPVHDLIIYVAVTVWLTLQRPSSTGTRAEEPAKDTWVNRPARANIVSQAIGEAPVPVIVRSDLAGGALRKVASVLMPTS